MDKNGTEQQILALLRTGPMLQKDIVAALPAKLYIYAGNAIRDMDARGLIRREKQGSTYIVTRMEAPE